MVRMQNLWVVDGLENGFLKDLWKERVFVGRLVAADEGLETLLLTEHPVKQTSVGFANVDATWAIDSLIQGELNALDQVKGDCILETASRGSAGDSGAMGGRHVHKLEADVGKVERLGGIGEVNGSVHSGKTAGTARGYMSEKIAMVASDVLDRTYRSD